MSQHHDLEAERAIIACVLLDPHAMDLVGDLAADDWYSTQNATVWAACQRLYRRREPIDPLTLRAELERMGDLARAGGDEHLTALTDRVPISDNVEQYAEIARGHASVRRVVEACQQTIAEAGRPMDSPETFMDAAEARLHEVSAKSRAEAGMQSADELMHATVADLEARQTSKGAMGMSTGFAGLDRTLSGLEAGQLVIVAGRPGMGKSAFAQAVALSAARQGERTVVFSLEMANIAWGRRLVQSQAGVDGELVKQGTMSAHDWTRIQQAGAEIAKLPLWIQHAPGLTLYQLRARCRRHQARHGLGLVVVDYLQLMRWHERLNSREEETSEISRGLKELAGELNVPVIALAQLNRDVEKRGDKRPQLADLRNSGAIEQDADVILFLFRPCVYAPNKCDQRAAEIIVGKQREGATGVSKATFRAEFTRFEDYNPAEFQDDQRAMGGARW